MTALWFSPICDQVLAKLVHWYRAYETGEVFATREWLNLDGIKTDRPTKYLHRIGFKTAELRHLVRILAEQAPGSHLALDFEKVLAGLRRGQLYPGGVYVVKLAFYRDDIREVVALMMRAKGDRSQKLEEVLLRQNEQGKDLFEM